MRGRARTRLTTHGYRGGHASSCGALPGDGRGRRVVDPRRGRARRWPEHRGAGRRARDHGASGRRAASPVRLRAHRFRRVGAAGCCGCWSARSWPSSLVAVGLGFLGYAELTIPLAAVVVGVALLLLAPVLDDRTPVAAGATLMVLGAAGAVLALGSAGQLYPQGLVGLGAGALLWLFGAHRTGLLAEVRARPGADRAPGTIELVMTLPLVFEAPRRALPPRHLADLDPADRRAAVAELGLPGYRADQLARHYFGRLTADLDRDDRPAGRRPRAARHACCRRWSPRCSSRPATTAPPARRSGAGHDGTRAESVLMGYPDRATVCVSSQAGCGMACPFCATGQGGLQRNLSTGEIVEQVRQAAAAARDGALGAPTRLSNVVFMGMGEPLANYKRVVDAVRRITEPAPGRAGHLRPRGHRLHRRAGAGDRQAGRRGPAGHAGGVPAHPGRRAARHPGAGEQPLEGRRGAGRGAPLRAGHRAPGVDRVRADPRRQRPAVAGRPAREGAAPAARAASGCTST